MAAFAIYNYTFRNVESIGIFMGQEDETSPLPTTEDKQNFVQQIFRDHLHGGREFECRFIYSFPNSQSITLILRIPSMFALSKSVVKRYLG